MATAQEEIARACPHSRRGLTPLGSLQKYPKIHISTGEESSGSSTDSTQVLRPRLRRERNPERPPGNSQGDWPFLRPPVRVAEVPVVTREAPAATQEIPGGSHLQARCGPFQMRRLEANQTFPLELRKVLHSLTVTQEIPRHTRLHSRGRTRVPPTSRGAPFPPRSSR